MEEVTPTLVNPESCDFSCQFEWLEISSNFFNVSVYTPAVVAGAVVYVFYRIVKKIKAGRVEKQ